MPIGTKVTLKVTTCTTSWIVLLRLLCHVRVTLEESIQKGFDGRGNFNMGVKEHIIFPEIDIDKVNRMMGMDITFVTTADSDEEGKALLDAFGFPFQKK